MRFKLQTDYALQALTYMAARQGKNCTTDEIADYYHISAAHLGRVIRRLQAHGYVKAIRGRRGGVRISRDPNALMLGEVVEVLEEGAQPLDPHDGSSPMDVNHGSRLRAVLRRGHGLFLSYLSQVSFGDLVVDGLDPVVAPAATETPSECASAPVVDVVPAEAQSRETPEPVSVA